MFSSQARERKVEIMKQIPFVDRNNDD